MSTASEIADLILRRGQIAGQGAANQGAIWGGTLRDIGQTVAQIPQQMQQQKMQAQEIGLRQQEMGLRQATLAAEQRKQSDSDALDRIYASGVFDENGQPNEAAILGKVSQTPGLGHLAPQLYQTFQKNHEVAAQTAKAKADAQKAQSDAVDAESTLMDHIASEAEAYPVEQRGTMLASLLAQAGKRGAIDADSLRTTVNGLFASPDHSQPPDQSMTEQTLKRMHAVVAAREAQKRQEALAKPVEVGRGGTLVQPATGTVIATGQPFETAPKGLQAKDVLIDNKPAVASFNPADGSWEVNGQKIDPARVKPMPPASVIYPKQDQTAAQTPPIKPGSAEYKVAQDLASGKLSFSQFRTLTAYGRDTGKKMAIYQTAAELNPEFNPSQFELGFKMASNPSFRNRLVAINALNPVIDQVDALAQQVGNTDVPAFNRLLQSAKFNIGNRPVTNFRQMQILLGDEVGNALGVGTASDLKTRLGLDLVNPNLGPKQFADTMEQLRSVLGARKAEILKQMGLYAPEQAAPAVAAPAAPVAPAGQPGNPLGLQRPRR